jgi:hypothetical protein
MATSAEIPEGVDLKSLRPGSLIGVETKSRHYRIESPGREYNANLGAPPVLSGSHAG